MTRIGRMIISALGAAAMVLLGTTAASASTTSADRPPAAVTSKVCSAHGSVALYKNQSMTTLVDYFAFNAPAREITVGTTVMDDDLQVDVTGDITDTAYIFRFQDISVSASGGSFYAVSADWRVTKPGGGIVADARNGSLQVTANGKEIVSRNFGPTEHGLFLSGFIGFPCPRGLDAISRRGR
jgi:hypothetical protein